MPTASLLQSISSPFRPSRARVSTLALVASGYAGSPPVHARLILTVRVRGTAVDVLSTELES